MNLARHGSRLRITGVLLLLAFLVSGLALGPGSFASNLLADGVGTLVALLFIDRLLASRRKAQWRLVSAATVETIEDAVVSSALVAYLMLEAPRQPQADPAMMADAGNLPGSLEALAERIREWSLIPPAVLETELLARRILAPTREIFEVVLPRLLLVGTEPGLIEKVVGVERAAHRLAYDASMAERFGFPPGGFLSDVAGLVESYAALATRIEEDPTAP